MKKLLFTLIFITLSFSLFANEKTNVVASTSWTAAFADLAGVDNVSSIAPASLRHPPEYEVTVSDIQQIHNSTFFIYAGFERMMKTLGDSVGNTQMVKITCDNSIETVLQSTKIISDLLGTQKESKKRVAKYISTIKDAANKIKSNKLQDVKVFCNKNQIYLAKDLGFKNISIFGPGPVTSEQIVQAKNENYYFIIDNVHNPVASPLIEVSPKSKYIVWRNFPEVVEKDALLKVIQDNISKIFE